MRILLKRKEFRKKPQDTRTVSRKPVTKNFPNYGVKWVSLGGKTITKIVVFLVLSLSFAGTTKATTITGTVIEQNGVGLTGTLSFKISGKVVTIVRVINGTIQSNNITPSPTGEYYTVSIKDSVGNPICTREVEVSGTSEDFSALQEVNPPSPITLYEWPTESTHVVN